MAIHTFMAFALFALVSSITPGPNNLMLLASGVNFGFRATLPHMMGINLGFMVLVLAVGVGLAGLFAVFPWLYVVLKWGGAAYLLYLAWNIANAGSLENKTQDGTHKASPMSFMSAAAFQWINPKAWIMALGAFSTYIPASSGFWVVALAAAVFALINLPSISLWVLFGAKVRHLLKVERNLRIFNYGMALLLVLSLYPMLVTS
ncbi:LysE family translocator [Undibacterium sp. CY18W]|uniref:LysE family translocator n=1 Tax=Undibacterium hunanense TaxID=2762292 RepID=A0ABR6ZS32_9BURK|nr:LysE family translocator [Undibacterium hunanense]MBC3918706.1 LysE family translocator [Undibacterium hunanense]